MGGFYVTAVKLDPSSLDNISHLFNHLKAELHLLAGLHTKCTSETDSIWFDCYSGNPVNYLPLPTGYL